MNIELRHLRAFVAVAEELNFTRAAERLFIAQQALSTQIRQLEERIGARLFERDTRRVELTPAGAALYQQAMPLLAGAEAAVEAARAAAEPKRRLAIGFVASVEHTAYAEVVAGYAQRRPEVELLIHFGDTTEPTGGLRTGETDVAFVYGPFDRTGIDSRVLFTEPLGVVMAATHPLAAVKDLTLDQVLAEPTFDFTTTDRAWHDYWMATAHRGGRPPRIVAHFKTLDALVEALRARLGVHTGTRSLAELGGGSLVWRPMSELAPLDHAIAWRADDTRAHVLEFVETVAQAFTVTAS